MRTGERVLIVVGGVLGTACGYMALRRAVPWTAREVLVVCLGAATVAALALAVSFRER